MDGMTVAGAAGVPAGMTAAVEVPAVTMVAVDGIPKTVPCLNAQVIEPGRFVSGSVMFLPKTSFKFCQYPNRSSGVIKSREQKHS